jgi:SAM-dependent methyltransferase
MLYKSLSLPCLYDLTQHIIRGRRFAPDFVSRFVNPKPGDRILDVGCGTGTMYPHLSRTHYVGFDMSAAYIAACRRRFGGHGAFFCESLDSETPKHFGEFDVVLAIGVLHHLNDAEAAHLFRFARQSLAVNGRLITLDGVFHEGQSGLVKWLLRNDRGKYVRTEKAYTTIATQEFDAVSSTIVDNLFRIPYTLMIMQCRR